MSYHCLTYKSPYRKDLNQNANIWQYQNECLFIGSSVPVPADFNVLSWPEKDQTVVSG